MERCCARTSNGRRCKLMTMGETTCYDVPVRACHHHINNNIIRDWSLGSRTDFIPPFIVRYLDIFESCYIDVGMGSRLSLAIATELYNRKDLTSNNDLIYEYFKATLKKSDKNECPICMEPDNDVVQTVCKHSFCRKCICDWCFTGKPECPMCRNKIYSKIIE